jgi:hypothetical protein
MKAIDSIFEQRWHFPQPKKQVTQLVSSNKIICLVQCFSFGGGSVKRVYLGFLIAKLGKENNF